jgi:uncharacterized protein YhjY with autotransporter beta-barrel domain
MTSVRILPSAAVGWSAVAWLATTAVHAQTLDEQYEFYLNTVSRRCENMNFEVDDELNVLPGQAGPRLAAFCSGPPLVGGGGGSASVGGGTGAAAGSGRGAAEDNALRRRQEALRNADEPKISNDVSVFDDGRTSVFFSLDYAREEQKTTHFEAGRDSHSTGGTLGADYRLGTQGAVGIAANYAELTGDFAASGGDFRHRSFGALIYGSWFPGANFLIDANLGIDRKQIDTSRIVTLRRTVIGSPFAPPIISFNPPPAAVDSDSDGRETRAEVRAGYDFVFGGTSIGPRAALLYLHNQLDGFTEQGDTPMALAFDEQTETSLRSSVGFELRKAFTFATGALQPQLSANWIHEFRDDQRAITARFTEDLRENPSRLRFLNERPDRDHYVIRASTVAVFAHGVSGFVSVEGTTGHAYIDRYAASMGVRVELGNL